jgi:menaquinone-dependent protoporphyrinogen oxidase
MFHWHRDALGFLKRHRQALSTRPLAIFAGGPIGMGDEKEWEGVRQQIDKELAKFPWLKPASVEVIGGRFDPAKLRFPYTLLPVMKQQPAKDLRDWDAIRAWAASLPEMLLAARS